MVGADVRNHCLEFGLDILVGVVYTSLDKTAVVLDIESSESELVVAVIRPVDIAPVFAHYTVAFIEFVEQVYVYVSERALSG